MDTVLCGGNTALVVTCPSSAGEFATKMAPRTSGVDCTISGTPTPPWPPGRRIHPRVVFERGEHANISITLDVYSHAIPAMEEEAAAKIAALFMPA